MKLSTLCLALAAALSATIIAAPATADHAPVATQTMTLTLDGARQVLSAAVGEARRFGAGGAFAVVDAGGALLAFERLDGTFAAASTVSVGKARTAAMFRKPTRVFEKVIRDGRTPMVALDAFTPLVGGVPIMVGDQVVGAIGVSGAASAEQDDQLAEFGAAGINAAEASGASGGMVGTMPTPPVNYLRGADVKAAFAKGVPLLETDTFKIHASRRDSPGEAEVHATETDIFYVLEGTATFVTGGTVKAARTTAPGETRGGSIDGGETRTLRPGDVIVVPNGTPHWFRGVEGPFLYYTVKVIGP